MKNKKKNGFTLTELMVVLVISAIVIGIAVPSFINYWRNAEFRKNEENARTAYLAAESKLTYYRSSGQWNDFKKEIEDAANNASDKSVLKGIFKKEDGAAADEKSDKIYALIINADDGAGAKNDNNLAYKLLDDYSYDKSYFDASLAIEIDIESGEVYSAFYGTKCDGLNYDADSSGGYYTMQKRDYDTRKKELLGYYSTDDTVNVVNLKPTRLRITTISLQNSEQLTLNWSSNVGTNLGVSYDVTFYEKPKSGTSTEKKKLFSMTVSPYDLRQDGWSATSNTSDASGTNMAAVTLKDASGTSKGEWSFPLTYSDNKYTMVLDAMMSAKVQAALSVGTKAEQIDLSRTSSTSILRLKEVASDLASPQNIYATVKATAYSGTSKANKSQVEYRSSEETSSNQANTMYGDSSTQASGKKQANMEISTFRHLSNIRYYNKEESTNFTLTGKNMDWTSVGTGVYDFKTNARANVSNLTWQENDSTQKVSFPTIAKLSENYTLKGNGSTTSISNLNITQESVVDDTTVASLNRQNSSNTLSNVNYVGMFGEVEGTIEKISFKESRLQVNLDTAGANGTHYSLLGIGLVAGRSEGELEDISVTDSDIDVSNVASGTGTTTGTSASGVGGVVGILANETTNQDGTVTFSALTSGTFKNVTASGTMNARIVETKGSTQGQTGSSTSKEEQSGLEGMGYKGGIGGLVGYAYINSENQSQDAIRIESCENKTEVSGNLFTGGIVGKIDGTFKEDANTSEELTADELKAKSNVVDCNNEGLVTCTIDTSSEENSLAGRYFGGAIGYGKEVLVYEVTSASGYSTNFSYNDSKKAKYLKGTYVGGIIGFGESTVLNNCSTQKGGYVLGSDYVGGIAGALSGAISQAIRADSSVAVTTNASYAIGNNYVGGIVGMNANKVELKHCINNGIAAGYEKYVGGIVGYNDNATIKDCASYLSDYNNSIYNMIVNTWNTTADYTGGVAGYNNGTIIFTGESESITVKSVSSIVVGQNYVGGIAGFNDVNATLNVAYELIGGRIHAYGNYAGGAFGLNASTQMLETKLTIQPRSVTGNYYVGGCIGANMVDIDKDTKMANIKSDNILGTITAEAFCGGVVGYQRTYTHDQLKQLGLLSSTTTDTGEASPIREALEKSLQTQQMGIASATDIFPTINQTTKVPTAVTTSKNTHTLTIATKENESIADSASFEDTNNIPISADLYIGGIVGYCEKDSKITVKNCKNSGNITQLSSDETGVKLADFVDSGEMEATKSSVDSDAQDVALHFTGGIISVNLESQIVDNCTSTGTMSGYSGIGGIVGLNGGLIYNCQLSEHFGNAALDYLGGIAGINIGNALTTGTSTQSAAYTAVSGSGTSQKTVTVTYLPGTIYDSTTVSNKTISGNSYIGGIVGWNMSGGIVEKSISKSSINAAGNYVGGVAGSNSGIIRVGKDTSIDSRTISGQQYVGGIAGRNNETGTVDTVSDNAGTTASNTEIVAVSNSASIDGAQYVGGITGANAGTMASTSYLTCSAKRVHASLGTVGGITGESTGDIKKAINRSTLVTADTGVAGGITATNGEGKTISNCKSYGSVSSSNGYAGGISATNDGTIDSCEVAGASSNTGGKADIYSLGTKEMGAITATNSKTGVISNATIGSNVVLEGEATTFGGITGTNDGTVKQSTINQMPAIETTAGELTVGGAVGQNNSAVERVNTGTSFSLGGSSGFSGYQYVGGIVGVNGSDANAKSAAVKECTFNGTIKEKDGSSTAGNCYGGITGLNYAGITSCNVEKITMDIYGVYTATSNSTATEKEKSASHAGGIAGKNEESATISGCLVNDNKDSSMTADYGMLGGVTGFNKGTIELSGSDKTANIMSDVKDGKTTVENLAAKASNGGLKKDANYVTWNGSGIENAKYNGGNTSVSASRLKMRMTSNGNVGGITAYNGTTGIATKCVSGDWFIVNKSESIGVGTGGVIGMNESEEDLTYLINGAFVGRQLSSGKTNRFAGGIIGNQNNSTSSDWTISHCINYGTVYCHNTHYSGGIMGQWTGAGGDVEYCLNYGNLQTTYQEGYRGASGGIVAQLYHAYEDNEYNVIHCGNYGSFYRASGSGGNGANDSAGIFGNVTNYYSSSADNSQAYTIQILDCFNAPGVQIYSNSMASGIFGFMSSDNPNTNNIINSTAHVILRIERCRNAAQNLSGNSFRAGIIGARYGSIGWKNTTVKDCYSVNFGNNYTSQPIYSNSNNMDIGGMSESNRKNNFIIKNNNEIKTLEKKTESVTGSSLTSFTSTSGNTTYWGKLDSQYVVSNIDLSSEWNERTWKNKSVDSDGYYGHIVNSNNKQVGDVLFYVASYSTSTLTTDTGNEIFVKERESYRRLEGIVNNKIVAPKSAAVKLQNGQIHLEITPQTLSGTHSGEKCDPFMYLVTFYDNNGNLLKTEKIYTEEADFDIPQGLSGTLSNKVKVQAVSMYDDVQSSEAITASTSGSDAKTKILPTPDIRAELTILSSKNDYRYKFSLNNLEDYKDYDGWQVEISVRDSGKTYTVTLREGNETAWMEDWNLSGGRISEDRFYQLNAQAKGDNFENSPLISVATYMPYFYPTVPLFTTDGQEYANPSNTSPATPSVEVDGDNLENLTIQVSLDTSDAKILKEVQPIYRAELIGTWKGSDGRTYNDVVFAKQDILVSSKGKASIQFKDLPDYLTKATNLRVRLWCAQTGLGPVYYYHVLDAPYTRETNLAYNGNGGIRELVSVDKNGKEKWAYAFSLSLQNYWSSNFENYNKTLDTNITWLSAPIFDLKDGSGLTPTYDSSGKLQYNISWDKGVSGTDNNTKYKVELVGITSDNKEVAIDTSDYTSGKSFTADAENWNYEKVKIKVTRLGDTSGSTKTIGLSSEATYSVSQRLARPSQPTVTNIDENELNYKVQWSPINPETNCAGYQIYVEDTSTGVATNPLITDSNKTGIVSVSEKNKKTNTYTKTLNLESYTGKRVRIYVVAVAKDGSGYVNSSTGITYELQIPKRISKPTISKWEANWTHDIQNPITALKFTDASGSVRIQLTANKNSIPPGGSAYLLKAYVYDSEAKAKAAVNNGTTPTSGYLYEYPTEADANDSTLESHDPVQMEVKSSTVYYHDLSNLPIEYAGKWIVFYTRISSGQSMVSSEWTKSTVIRLPYVQLAQPDVSSDTADATLDVQVSENPDFASETEQWTAKQTILQWNSVECANYYTIDLAGQKTDSASETKSSVEANVRIMQRTDDDGNDTLTVQQKVMKNNTQTGRLEEDWEDIKNTSTDTTGKLSIYPISEYSVTISANYQTQAGASVYYEMTLTAELEVVKNDDGSYSYTLHMPDVSDVKAKDGTTITHDNFAITTDVAFVADVIANHDDDGTPSDAFVASDKTEIEW